jgi:hypothetical protein
MQGKTIQLIGQVSDDLDYMVKFAKREQQLYDQHKATANITVINPVTICSYRWSWRRCMAKCLWSLVFNAKAVAVMPDFKDSRGAKIELAIAILTGKEIIWL